MLRASLTSCLFMTAVNAYAIELGSSLFGSSLVGMASESRRSSIDLQSVLTRISEKENRSLPKLINEDIRLDKLVADEGSRMIKQFTLLNDASVGKFAEKYMKGEADLLKNEVCSEKSSSMFLKHGVSVTHQYSDYKGQPVREVKVSPSDCS